MRAVLVDAPPELLEERRRKGLDVRDEMWEGVVHLVPPSGSSHQRIGGELYVVLHPLAKALGLVALYESGVFRPGTDKDYRVPDQVYARPEHVSERGVEGAAVLVVELRSPRDETYDKFGFYAAVGVEQVLVVDPATRVAELFVNRGASLLAVQPNADGELRLDPFDVVLRTLDGPRLRVRWAAGETAI